MGEERELKLALTAEEADRLEAAYGPPQRILHQQNTYLDARDGRLRRERIGLRLRREREGEAERYLLTLKGPTQWSAGLAVRREDEVALTIAAAAVIFRDGLDPHAAPLAALRALAADLSLGHMEPLGTMNNERTILPLPGQPGILLELDRSHYPDGSTACEVEVERPPGAADPAPAVRAALSTGGIAWRPQTQGKFSRFLETLGQP